MAWVVRVNSLTKGADKRQRQRPQVLEIRLVTIYLWHKVLLYLCRIWFGAHRWGRWRALHSIYNNHKKDSGDNVNINSKRTLAFFNHR